MIMGIVFCLTFNSGSTVGSDVTENDMLEVIQLLCPEELQILYVKLDISHKNVRKAEDGAGLNDPTIKAMAVLRQWKQTKGKDASKKKILDAMKQCKFMNSYEQLKKIWRL